MFFVKYNDPIYVKLEKLDIMIRLASQANIAQVRLAQTPSLRFCIEQILREWKPCSAPILAACMYGSVFIPA